MQTEIQKLTEKLQVLLTKEESTALNSAILEDAIEDNQRPVSVSAFIRNLIKNELNRRGKMEQKSYIKEKINKLNK
jgi:hypothetical protein